VKLTEHETSSWKYISKKNIHVFQSVVLRLFIEKKEFFLQ